MKRRSWNDPEREPEPEQPRPQIIHVYPHPHPALVDDFEDDEPERSGTG